VLAREPPGEAGIGKNEREEPPNPNDPSIMTFPRPTTRRGREGRGVEKEEINRFLDCARNDPSSIKLRRAGKNDKEVTIETKRTDSSASRRGASLRSE
jgi:hypothetical protein